MDNDTYLHNSTVIKKLDDLSVAIGGSEVPTTTIKTNSDFVIGINKSIDAASGKTGVEYPPYAHNTLVTNKLDELAKAIAEGGGGGPAPVMGALTATENGNYIPSDYDYDGFNSVSVNVPEPPTPVTDVLNVTENGTYLPSDYGCDAFSQVNVNVAPTPTFTVPEFNKTLLVNNSSKASSFTLTGDYHDYDFVLIKLDYNGIIETVFIPPSVIDACTTSPFSYLNLNKHDTNIYATYAISNNTWTKVYNRVTDIIEIYGCNCINAAVTETEIYYASALSGTASTVQYAGDLTNFDYIFVVCNSSDRTECIVNDAIWTPTKMVNENTFTMNEYTNGGYVINNSISKGNTNGYPMMYYSQSTTVTLTEHELSLARYLYVTGIKFTPN